MLDDIRFALRQLRKSPGFTLTAIATLALGIGANTAIFSVVASVLLSPLPFPDSDRLVRIVVTRAQADGHALQTSPAPVDFHFLRSRSQLLERVAAQKYQDATLISDQGPAERVTGIAVSDQWLETLGVKPILGRGFDKNEQAEGSNGNAALISYGFWQRYFGGRTDAVGKTLRLNDRNYIVVGVMPRQFRYPYEADLWFPMTLSPTATRPGDLNIVGRLKPGVTDSQFGQELDAIATNVAREFSDKAAMGLVARRFEKEFQRDPNGSIITLVFAVAFVLTVACVNLANLQFARGQTRIREMAIRSAIGASRWRQIRLLLTESLVLAVIGGACSLLLTSWGTSWLAMLIPPRVGEVVQQVRVNTAVLMFATASCLLTAFLFGFAPALRLSQDSPAAALKDVGRQNSTGGGKTVRLLIIAQVALAFVLLIGAGLMSQNLMRLLRTNVGYEPANLLKIELGLPPPRYNDAALRIQAVDRVVRRIETLPGVVATGVTTLQPIPRTTSNELTAITLERFADPNILTMVNQRIISSSYFRAMGMRITRGSGFTEQNTETSNPVLIINEAAARRFWPAEDPIASRLKPGRIEDTNAAWHTIIGVVNDIGEPDDEDETRGTIYRVYPQAARSQSPGSWRTTSVSLMVRTAGESPMLLKEIRELVREIDPALPLYGATSMQRALARPLSNQSLGTALFVGFGAFGLFMAALGTYGVIASSVNQRVPEFGIRMALGARPFDLLRLVITEGLRLVLIGLIIGTLSALMLSRLLAAVTTEIGARDPFTFAAASIVLLLAGTLACWLPARRAARVDPVTALRAE